ncbi:NRAMP family divalent metal transporter [Arcobacter peruensis]|uniref:NRAMP family divalent metal transporter n=1 Tax=Arcobacter peruensis TaxID=2320140 RepID=UPI0019D25F9E|nr:divalent metal cation transporter [Arcobacter peruensis]
MKEFLKNFGPGIIMASSAVGGSHIIASTQAGAYYGYQLALFIIVVNLLKYPFYRFAFDYSTIHNKTLLQGYSEKGNAYLWVFLVFNAFATVVNVAGGTLLSAVLLKMLIPLDLSLQVYSIFILLTYLFILYYKQYKALDSVSKIIMLFLSVVTIIALILAFTQTNTQAKVDFIEPNAFQIAAIPFLIALMGWMPSPMELSVSASIWVVEKNKLNPEYKRRRLIDFNSSYLITIVLALMFMSLGALVQYGQDITPLSGGKFINQFIDMYATSIGEWTRGFITFIAFICLYGTTIVAVDGYSRCNHQSIVLLKDKTAQVFSHKALQYSMLFTTSVAFIVIQFFSSSIGKMIPFAMTASFISAPVFAYLNYSLSKQYEKPTWLTLLALLGLIYLASMVVVYFIFF